MQKTQIIAGILGVVIAGLGAGWYFDNQDLHTQITNLQTTNNDLFEELADTKTKAASTTAAFEAKVTLLTDTLTATEDEREDLQSDLRKEKNRNDDLEDEVDDLEDEVEVLDKLANTDDELLQKYSKVSFLNEHYAPEKLKEIDDEWKYNEDREHKLHASVMPFFEDMLEDAEDDNVELWVVSAFRSFEEQQQIKGNYLVTYGTGANAFSADQGFSEHQLGTAVDFTTRGMNGGLTNAFADTEAYEWLLDNAHKYGFVLSYPPDNEFYIFEPWHWRFVGDRLAKDLKRDDAYFYDWEQREIDEYLIKIFD